MISIITPAFNETQTLKDLYARIVHTMNALAVEWEWVVVDDHSFDDTFGVVRQLAASDPRVRGQSERACVEASGVRLDRVQRPARRAVLNRTGDGSRSAFSALPRMCRRRGLSAEIVRSGGSLRPC